MKPDPTWSKWADWLGRDPKPGTIYKDVVDMRAARQIWESFQAIVGVAPDEAKKFGTFHSWFNSSYIRSQGLAIRRQVEVRDDVVSLGRLLDRIAKSPNVLSRERYLAELHPDDRRLGNEFFDSLTTPGSMAIDPDVPLGSASAPRRSHDPKRAHRHWTLIGTGHEPVTRGGVHATRIANRWRRLRVL